MRSRGILFFVAGALLALAAKPPSKPAWRWTVDERLAARFDETARNQRVDDFLAERTARHGRQSALGMPPPLTPRPTDVIHGSKHPELFLPSEIFTTFTRLAYEREDDTAKAVREHASQRAVPIGLPADFLVSWEHIAQRFIAFQREELQLRRDIYSGKSSQRKRDEVRLRELTTLECRSRAVAIRDLRAKFGSRFDQFLYEVAAPNISRDIYEPVSAQKLRAEEEGCP